MQPKHGMTNLTSPFRRDRITWMAYLMLAFYAFQVSMIGPLMPFLRAELNLSYTTGGMQLSVLSFGVLLAGLSGDKLARQLGRKATLWGGGLCATCGALSLALSNQLYGVIAGIFVMGLCGALVQVMVQAILADQHGEHRAIAFSESNIGASFTSMLAPATIGLSIRLGFGWRGAVYLALIVLCILFFTFRNISLSDTARREASRHQKDTPLPASYWIFWLVIGLVIAIEWSLFTWSPDFLEKEVGLARVDAVTSMSLFFLAAFLGRIAGGYFSRLFPVLNLLLLALAISLAGFPVFWAAQMVVINLAGLFITGFGVGNHFPFSLTAAVSQAPQQADKASARTSLAVGFSGMAAPFMLGWLADQIGLKPAFLIILVFNLLAILLVWRVERSVKLAKLRTGQRSMHESASGA